MMKLLLGGSPCTHWSIAQSRHRETRPEGQGWELFRNYLIAKERYCPDFFLYENNKSMVPAIREQITAELGVKPIFINSALVSAQSRQRLYWTNIPGVEQPEDRGLVLRDILESGLPLREKGYTLKANYANSNAANALDSKHFPATMAAEPIRVGAIESSTGSEGQGHRVYSADGKSKTLCGNGGGAGAKTGLYTVPTGMAWRGHANADNPSSFEARPDQKANAVIVGHQSRLVIETADGRSFPAYEVKSGRIAIKGREYPIRLADGFYIIRKLTVLECMRLQTVPEDYIFPVSNSQAYKMLGNGWTVEVIAHILSYCPGITAEPVEVLSMYDGMSCGRLALNKLGADVVRYYATEIDKYAIRTTKTNFPDTLQMGDAFRVREDGWRSFTESVGR
ncbi:DNA cytosine methyltransferase [Acutalibacter muris]|uniref:DNA cytosine methyltransferase n=2 Tax=Acutalibacter muris TaxID=1796620 RepID=UPI001C3F603E|nr:DNA cytosine methyltransferase [Acutalibacter muris]